MIVKAMAPGRILDFGGWTDCWFAGGGSVLNFAVNRYAMVTVTGPLPHPGTVRDAGGVIEVNPLIEAVLASFGNPDVDILIESEISAGSGMGGSSALAVALCAALARMRGTFRFRHQNIRLAFDAETVATDKGCGLQDHYAAGYGGVSFLSAEYPGVIREHVELRQGILDELESRLLVVNTGVSHCSSDVHKSVIERLESKDKDAVEGMCRLKSVALQARLALEAGDWTGFAEAMNETLGATEQLHPEIISPDAWEIIHNLHRAGAMGFKVNGAGCGGTVTVLCGPSNRTAVKAWLEDFPYEIIPCRLDFGGVRSWISE